MTHPTTYPTPDDIAAAAARIAGRVRKTPILALEPGALGLPFP
jgi:threonine dehydratase